MFLKEFRKLLSEIFLSIAKLIYPGFDKKEPTCQPKLKPFNVPTDVVYPTSYDLKKAKMLVDRVHQASNTYLEAKIFQSILQNAYDEAKDLFTLNYLVPEVLKGNPEARDRFEQIFEKNIKRHNIPRGRPASYQGYKRPDTIPQSEQKLCYSSYFIDQDAVYNVIRTVSHIASKEDQYHDYINVVEHIWGRGRCLDDLMRAAFVDDKAGRPSQQGELREILDKTAIDNKLYDRNQELDERFRNMPQAGGGETDPSDEILLLENGTIDPGEGGNVKWPPRGPGWEGPLGGCGDKPRPDPIGPTGNPCDILREMCRDMIINGSRGGLRRMPNGQVETDNIDSIEPTAACAGDQIRILGHGFENEQGERDVVINSRPMEVVSWSDREIVVVIPDGTGPGCIGIRDRQRENERWNIYVENQRTLEELNAGLMCLRMESIISFPYHPTPASCNERLLNRFEGTVPVIQEFLVNNRRRLEVERETALELTWQVENTTEITIQRVSGNGPTVNLNNPGGNFHNAGIYNSLSDITVYELEASNRCGSVTRRVIVTLAFLPMGEWETPYNNETPDSPPVHAALLHTGRVLFIPHGHDEHVPDTFVWDPTIGDDPSAFSSTDNQPETDNQHDNLYCSGHSFLSDGQLLVVGGGGRSPRNAINKAWRYDPVAGTNGRWTRTARDMTNAQWYPTVVTLGSGRVFVVGGRPNEANIEIYDEDSDGFDEVNIPEDREFLQTYPGLHLLPGPGDEIFNTPTGFGNLGSKNYEGNLPAPPYAYFHFTGHLTGEWVAAAECPTASSNRVKGMSVLLLLGPDDGSYLTKVMVVGGNESDTAELFHISDVNNPTCEDTPAVPGEGRNNVNVVILPDNTVFVCGGATSAGVAVPPCALYNPMTNSWSEMASLKAKRAYHSVAVLLPSGQVMITGDANRRIEIFNPPYLFKGSRPDIISFPDTVHYGLNFDIETPQAFDISKIVLVRPMAVTHQTDTEQRVIGMTFRREGNILHVNNPNSNHPHPIAPPGYYMLFIINNDGAPSVGEFLLLHRHPD